LPLKIPREETEASPIAMVQPLPMLGVHEIPQHIIMMIKMIDWKIYEASPF
jgi:hypothetical protein